MTDAEQVLWQRLRRKQIDGLRFRRQFPLGHYIVDFVCLPARLIVEVDGGQHMEAIEYDTARDFWLGSQEFRVLQFWNNQVLHETDAVIEEILQFLNTAADTPTPTLPRQGGGSGHRGTKSHVGSAVALPPPLAGGGEGEG